MKTKFVLFAFFVAITFSSCEKIKDAVAIDVETELSTDIPVESTLEVGKNQYYYLMAPTK